MSVEYRNPTPRTWLVMGNKTGDNAQVEAIAQSLDWPVARKRLTFREQYSLQPPRFRATLHHLDVTRSDPLVPPWPDLILAIGRRPMMAALWVRGRSNGRTRVVAVGRPRGRAGDIDLCISARPYRVFGHPRVLRLDLPRIAPRPASGPPGLLAKTLDRQERPWLLVLIGGPAGILRLDPSTAIELLARARRVMRGAGTMVVVTSRRTPAAVTAALRRALPPRAHLLAFDDASSRAVYPYILERADRVVVTGDSVTMLIEAVSLGKSTAIFPLPLRQEPWAPIRAALPRVLSRWTADGRLAGLERLLGRAGLVLCWRDLEDLHRFLIARGLAVWLGAPFVAPPTALLGELPQVQREIRAILGQCG